jgi:predicted secreted Zn-dependent protease
MGLPKGRTNNLRGKPKGTVSKSTKELREFITAFVSQNLDKMQEDFDRIEDPKDRLMFLERLFQYSLPRLQAQSFEVHQPVEFKNLPEWMKT